jgi:hypothetical protein
LLQEQNSQLLHFLTLITMNKIRKMFFVIFHTYSPWCSLRGHTNLLLQIENQSGTLIHSDVMEVRETTGNFN